MRYIIEIKPETDAQIRRLIEQDKYLSTYQFIDHAIEGLLHIEDQTIDFNDPMPISNEQTYSLTAGLKVDSLSRQLESENLAEPHKIKDYWGGCIEDIPWLWGQINSVLCIKFVLRIIVAKQRENPCDVLLLSNIKHIISDAAVRLCNNLDSIDKSQKRARDSKFSISFPKNNEKSRDRFVSHYLGYVDGKKKPKGALVQLGFARISGDRKNATIKLTPAGLHFGELSNPLIDGDSNSTTSNALTEAEVDFYISHIFEHAPCEKTAFNVICKLISEGNNTPQSLEDAAKRIRPHWSEAEAVTYKGGALARMYQLGIITKEKMKKGAIEYKVDDIAKQYGIL